MARRRLDPHRSCVRDPDGAHPPPAAQGPIRGQVSIWNDAAALATVRTAAGDLNISEIRRYLRQRTPVELIALQEASRLIDRLVDIERDFRAAGGQQNA